MPDADAVRTMFDRIAGRYDLMNRVMTLGIDQRWRRAAVEAVRIDPSSHALDVCCGTGDITFMLADAGAKRTVGLDFSLKMLEQARARLERRTDGPASAAIEFIAGDATKLPFDDDTFDALTVSFGIRNVDDIPGALREFIRVLRPGGRLGCLEITRPSSRAANAFYDVWFDRLVPRVGGIIAGDREAYTYLPESTKHFPRPPEFADMIRAAGGTDVNWRRFGGGIVALHTARVPMAVDLDARSTASHDRSTEPVLVR